MNYDPKLRECMAEIVGLLKKYDCGGFVALTSETHSEFKMCIEEPSWSNARFLKEGKAIHVRLHAKSDHKRTEATVALLFSIRDMTALAFQQAESLVKQIRQVADVDHKVFGTGINNDDR